MKMTYTYNYPRPMVTVDIIVVSTMAEPKLLLIKRCNEPYKECWAIPGGFLEMDEELESAALRELKEETGLDIDSCTQFKTFGSLNRDPRGRTISVVFYAFIDGEITPLADSDASEAGWFPFQKLPELAFDHDTIVSEFTKAIDLRQGR